MREINEMLWQLLAGIACGQESACGSKVRHETEQDAQGLAALLNARPGRAPRIPYPCPWCLFWHVGHMKSTKMMYLARKSIRKEETQ